MAFYKLDKCLTTILIHQHKLTFQLSALVSAELSSSESVSS